MSDGRLADRAIDHRKITEYLLNPDSPTGAGKCRFFESFGFHAANWRTLHDALIRHPLTAQLADTQSSPYGEKQIYRCSIRSPDGRNPCILSVWQHREGRWNLITAYPGAGR